MKFVVGAGGAGDEAATIAALMTDFFFLTCFA